jgi:hypothetical protein
VTSEERRILEDLADLTATPIPEQGKEELLAGYRTAARSTDITADLCRQFLVELKKHYSWAELVKLTGDPQSTLYNRANPRRVRLAEPGDGDQDES